jgi:integrase
VTLNLILQQAVEWGYLHENPAQSVKMPRRPPKPDLVVLTYQQMTKLLEALSEPYKTMVQLVVLTGMRRCELFALRRMDVDLEQAVIHIRQRVYRGQIDTPKSTMSIRELPLPRGWPGS